MAREDYINWLKDAHAMELSVANTLERHAKDAENDPEVREKIQRHLKATEEHARKVELALRSIGEEPSTTKDMTAKMTGAMQGMTPGRGGDKMIKNAIAEYATEHFEIASYKSIIEAAEEQGDKEVARVAREILADEQRMADWLEGHIGEATMKGLEANA